MQGSRRPPYVHLVLLTSLLALVALNLLIGVASLGRPELVATLLTLRLARTLAALLTGMALAGAGVMVQGLFRNPLASPSILGTTAGAALGGRVALLVTSVLGTGAASVGLMLPLGCLLGALGALLLLLAVVRFKDDLVVVLLTGFLLSSLFLSLGGLATSLAQDRWELARAMLAFALGDVSSTPLSRVALVTPLVVGGLVAGRLWATPMDLLLTGQDEAASLGLEVRGARRWIVIWVAVLTAAAVCLGGNIGFVGLVVPHVLRRFVGVKHAVLLPAAALGGGVFVLACDCVSRLLPTSAEVPLGVITGLVGAPLFLVLLVRSRRVQAFGS